MLTAYTAKCVSLPKIGLGTGLMMILLFYLKLRRYSMYIITSAIKLAVGCDISNIPNCFQSSVVTSCGTIAGDTLVAIFW